MHTEWKGPYQRRLQQRASERGKVAAARRWELDRRRRADLAAKDPIRVSAGIVRRIVVIDEERSVREAVIYDFDSVRSARRKLRVIITEALTRAPNRYRPNSNAAELPGCASDLCCSRSSSRTRTATKQWNSRPRRK